MRIAILAALSFALTACATPQNGAMSRMTDQPAPPQLSVLEENARIPFVRSITGFRLTADNQAVLLDAPGPNFYLVEVWETCRRDLPFANAIGVDARPAGSLDKFGALIIDGRRCPIQRVARVADPRAQTPKAGSPATG